jgi:hypothetical protein
MRSVTESGAASPATDEPVSVEAPEADAVEQRAEVVPEDDDAVGEIPLDVDPADAVEQHRTVAGDDDDYR